MGTLTGAEAVDLVNLLIDGPQSDTDRQRMERLLGKRLDNAPKAQAYVALQTAAEDFVRQSVQASGPAALREIVSHADQLGRLMEKRAKDLIAAR